MQNISFYFPGQDRVRVDRRFPSALLLRHQRIDRHHHRQERPQVRQGLLLQGNQRSYTNETSVLNNILFVVAQVRTTLCVS